MSLPSLSVQRAGVGAVNADQLNTYVQGCNTYADLRAFIGIDGIPVYTRGGVSIDDGLQGQFYWDSSSNATDDGFNVLQPAGVITGRWLRLSQDIGPWLAASPSYANDAAAAAGGVPVGGLYRNASAVQMRIS